MRRYTPTMALILLGTHLGIAGIQAEEPAAGSPGRPAASRSAGEPAASPSESLTVAILDFTATAPGAPDLGGQIGEVLTAVLSGEPGFTLVERASLTRTLQEHELNLTGVVETEQAIKIGRLVGAKILVTGKAFVLGKNLFITAKLIGTETSLVKGLLVKADTTKDPGALVIELAMQLGELLRTDGSRLVASRDPVDPVPALKKRLAQARRPTVAVIVTEEHRAGRPQPPPVDPAVETEIKRLLKECGFEIADVAQNDLADWAHHMDHNNVNAWPRGLQGVDVVITGEAFSEFAARIGNLVSCSARAEVNLISRKDGRILLADRETTRGVDLSEHIAGKKALEKSGRALAIRILEHFARALSGQGDAPIGEATTP